jgi:hypothetical protein
LSNPVVVGSPGDWTARRRRSYSVLSDSHVLEWTNLRWLCTEMLKHGSLCEFVWTGRQSDWGRNGRRRPPDSVKFAPASARACAANSACQRAGGGACHPIHRLSSLRIASHSKPNSNNHKHRIWEMSHKLEVVQNGRFLTERSRSARDPCPPWGRRFVALCMEIVSI